MVRSFCSLALAAVLATSPILTVEAAAQGTPQCPGSVATEQTGQSTEGWTATRLPSQGGGLIGIAVSEGPPEKEFILVPNESVDLKGSESAFTNIWIFEPSTDGFWISCLYQGTEVALTRRLPDGVKRCEVDVYAPDHGETVGPIRCQ